MKYLLLLLISGLSTIALNAQQSKPAGQLVDQYMSIKNALVGDDAAMAAERANTFLKTLEEQKVDALKKDTKTIADSKDLKKQRAAFASLSELLYKMVKADKPGTTIYWQHCPMYNNGKGGNWLSLENEVKNPFYGDMMLNCGSTVETIQ